MHMMGWDMMGGNGGGSGVIGWMMGFLALWMMLFGTMPFVSFRDGPQ
jgi:hypothetical protein